jgi:hypothetical protein
MTDERSVRADAHPWRPGASDRQLRELLHRDGMEWSRPAGARSEPLKWIRMISRCRR